VNSEQLSVALSDAFEGTPQVKTFGADNRVKITTAYRISDEGVTVDDEVLERLTAGLVAFGSSGEVLSSQKVGLPLLRTLSDLRCWRSFSLSSSSSHYPLAIQEMAVWSRCGGSSLP
jgi:hypothetical protein